MIDYSKLYDFLLSAHSFFPYLLGKGRSLPPVRVQLELTYRCNLQCFMCYQDKNMVKREEELGGHEWIALVDQLPPFCLITFIGGEPLLHSGFREIAEHAFLPQFCNLVTNGVLLTEEMNKFLIERKFVLIGVSLDGTKEIHDKIRRVKGTYQEVVTNLRNLQEQKKEKRTRFPLLDIKTLVLEENLDNLWELFAVTQELKADFFTLSLPKVSINQFNPCLRESLEHFSPFDFSLLKQINFSKLRKTLQKIINVASKTKVRLYPDFKSIEEIGRSLYNPKKITDFFLPCHQPWTAVQIKATGDVYPCLSLKMGNIREKPFSQIWNGEKFMNFRKVLKKKKLLSACLGCCYLKQKR